MTSFIEMLELLNFGHMSTRTSTIWFKSRDKILMVLSWTKIMTSKCLFQNIFISRRPRAANFAAEPKRFVAWFVYLLDLL